MTQMHSIPDSKDMLGGKKEVKRQKWASKADFILTCIGYSVGLGNIWRFPYLCYKNGGGVFLVPYLLTMIICGLPVAVLEQSAGQYVGLGAVTFWKLSPAFKGIGIAYALLNMYVSAYYICVIVYSFHYFFSTFTADLPWAKCNNAWNTEHCFEFLLTAQKLHHGHVGNGTDLTINSVHMNASTDVIHDLEYKLVNESTSVNSSLTSPSEEYFMRKVLNITSGVEYVGGIQWQLMGCLLLAWIIVYFSTIKSIRSTGKVAYLTATFPYVMLSLLVIRGSMLPGSVTGVIYYLKPDLYKLLDPTVWFNASLQIFHSIGLGYGFFVTMSSYNKFENNCVRDATITVLINSATSVFAGFAVFTVLGAMAYELGISVDDVVQSGPGLAFVAYPRAMLTMPLPQLWAALFFFMLILLGISSEVCHFETVLSAIADEFPRFRSMKIRAGISAVIVLSLFSVGLIFVTQGGMYYFAIADLYSTSIGLMLVAFLECIILTWIYGLDRISDNIEQMTGKAPNWYFKACWKFLSPIMILLVLGVSLGVWKPATLGDYEYPSAANAVGWGIAILPLLPIPVIFIYRLVNQKGESVLQRIKKIVQPDDDFKEHIRQRMIRDYDESSSTSDSLVLEQLTPNEKTDIV